MEPEVVTFGSQARLLVIKPPNDPENLPPKMCPAYKMFKDKDRAETDGMANQCLAQIETYAMRKSQSLTLTLLMILSYTYRQDPSIIVL